MTAVLQETFAGIKVVKAFGSESREFDRFRTENKTFYRFIRKVLKYDSASAPVMELLGYAGVAGVLWYGLHRVLGGAMTKGELMSFVAARSTCRCVITSYSIHYTKLYEPMAVIGSDGFGFAPDGDRYFKIPQVGIVEIDDDVDRITSYNVCYTKLLRLRSKPAATSNPAWANW